MTQKRGPHHSKKCPFHILANQPLSAKKSIARCVNCVSCNDQRLQGMKADLHQIAHLVVSENLPKYDSEHPTGASLSTFIRSRVCAKLRIPKKSSKRRYFTHEVDISDLDPGLYYINAYTRINLDDVTEDPTPQAEESSSSFRITD